MKPKNIAKIANGYNTTDNIDCREHLVKLKKYCEEMYKDTVSVNNLYEEGRTSAYLDIIYHIDLETNGAKDWEISNE